jgi:hypothetical protein
MTAIREAHRILSDTSREINQFLWANSAVLYDECPEIKQALREAYRAIEAALFILDQYY